VPFFVVEGYFFFLTKEISGLKKPDPKWTIGLYFPIGLITIKSSFVVGKVGSYYFKYNFLLNQNPGSKGHPLYNSAFNFYLSLLFSYSFIIFSCNFLNWILWIL